MSKKKVVKNYEITPDVTLFGKLGARSRAFPMVVTELVDNSLDSWISMPASKKKGKSLKVEISAATGKNPLFTVSDNAGGMTMDELALALTVAKSDKTGNNKLLGHFGMGLKSALMYIGSEFTIFTMSYKKPNIVSTVTFNLKTFEKSGSWRLDFYEISKDEAVESGIVFPKKHGTTIRVKSERYKSSSKPGIIRKLENTFAPLLPKDKKLGRALKTYPKELTEEINIVFGGEHLQAAGHFYTPWVNDKERILKEVKVAKALAQKSDYSKYSTSDILKSAVNVDKKSRPSVIPDDIKWLGDVKGINEIKLTRVNGKSVFGRIGLLDRGMAHNNDYGIDLIKNGRVIESNVLDRDIKNRKIGLSASNHNARIVGQLYLDDWDTDHQKSSFLKDSEDWEGIIQIVSDATKIYLAMSSFLQNPNKLIPSKSNVSDFGSVTRKKLTEKTPLINKTISSLTKSTAVKAKLTQMETRTKKQAKPVEKKTLRSNTKITSTKTELKFVRGSANGILVETKVKKTGKNFILQILINQDHPFLKDREYSELKVLGEFIGADRFAQYIFESKGSDDYRDFIDLREVILKGSSPES
jgi:hypothetical protein